jgi:hypothetical protein
MGGWSTIDMHGAWHPIPFNEDGHGMVGYEFNVTWVCFAKEPIRIKFYEENRSNLEKEREREWVEAKYVRHYFCT